MAPPNDELKTCTDELTKCQEGAKQMENDNKKGRRRFHDNSQQIHKKKEYINTLWIFIIIGFFVVSLVFLILYTRIVLLEQAIARYG
jgi:hypothetical protein